MTQPAAIHTTALRCTHRLRASGRQCRSLAAAPSGLCAHYMAKQKAREKDSDFANLLMGKALGFQTQGINHSLARDPISLRRAATLAYICGLLLRSLPTIDRDISSGVEAGLKCALEAKQSSSASSPGKP